jgi:diguanylate cyclase (GGDEF)-like protein/PAS domain S-box-containing protein
MSPLSRIHAIAALVFALTLAASAAYIWQFEASQDDLRVATLRQGEQRAGQLASSMGAQIGQLMRGVDFALLKLRDEYLADRPGFERSARAVLRTFGDDALHRVVVIGADGHVTYNSLGEGVGTYLGDRDHVRFHVGDGEDRLYVSKPLFGRVAQVWSVLMTRAIRRDGKLAGVVVIVLTPEYLAAQMARVTLSPEDVVVLLQADGTFLSRTPDWRSVMGKTVAADRPFLAAGAADRGVFRAPASTDKTPRIFAWHRDPSTGLLAVVGLSEAALFAPIDAEIARGRRRTAAIVVLMLILGGGGALLLLRVARQQQQLVANEQRYRRLHESMVDAYVQTDMAGHLREWNRAYQEMLGYAPEDLRRKTYVDLTPARWHEMEAGIVAEQIVARGYSDVYEKEYVRADGAIFPVELRTFLLRDERGTPIGMWAIVRDVTERKLAEAQIHHIAHHDALTGLPNRLALGFLLEQAMATARREERLLAVMLIDLDRFKNINDTLGHLVGDRLLIEVAQRLKSTVRDSDLIARLGGDEFVVTLTQVAERAAMEKVAEKIQLVVSQPYELDGHQLHTTPSIGISLFPRDGESVEALIRHADAAMYHAKAQGRDNWQFFSEQIREASAERLRLETGLRGALQRGEFLLHFQPQLDVAAGRIVAVEALLRWRHPVMGSVAPERFIPVAEDMGLIVPLGDWILDRACGQIRAWRDDGLDGIRVAVNLSALQLRRGDLRASVARALDRNGLCPQDLELEVTESMAMRNPAETIGILGDLKQLGVTLAVDDFGTGYSSLSYLKLLPIDCLKLDRSFVGDIETDPSDATICRATTSLAHDLGLKLIAEGVETEAQFVFLKGLGCDLIQGYWLSEPLTAAEARDTIARHNAAAGN